MNNRQKKIRLTVRATDEFDSQIREKAKELGLSVNQFLLNALNQ